MTNEYKSIYTGQQVDEAVSIAQKSLTTDNVVQTTGPSQTNIMSQSAVTAALKQVQIEGGGTKVIVNGEEQLTWNADTKVDVAQGATNVGKAMIVGADGNLSPQSIPANGTTVTVGGQAQSTWDADTKINVFQGTTNAGKSLVVGQDGNVVLQTSQASGTIVQINGVAQSTIDFTSDPQTQLNDILQEVETNGSEIQTLQTDIGELGNELNSLSADKVNINQGTENSGKCLAINTSGIVSPQNVTELEATLLYDMNSTDPNINLSNQNPDFVNGMQGAQTVSLDTSGYKYLRVYASLNGFEAQSYVDIQNAQKLEFFLKTNNTAFMQFYFMRFSLTTNRNVFTAGQYCVYAFNATDGTFTRTIAARSADYYIYRIEGIK